MDQTNTTRGKSNVGYFTEIEKPLTGLGGRDSDRSEREKSSENRRDFTAKPTESFRLMDFNVGSTLVGSKGFRPWYSETALYNEAFNWSDQTPKDVIS